MKNKHYFFNTAVTLKGRCGLEEMGGGLKEKGHQGAPLNQFIKKWFYLTVLIIKND